MKLKINPSFRDLIPPLTAEEHKELEASILTEGCRDALTVWNNFIVDGHNRYAICKKHNLYYPVNERQFTDESEAKIWIIKNQFGRRNINNATRAMLALELEPLIAEKAKRNQIAAGGDKVTQAVLPNSTKAVTQINTRKVVADLAGVSTGTIYEAKKVKEAGTEDIKQKMLANKISIHKAYTETFPVVATEKHCRVCGKTKPSADFYANKSICKECDAFKSKHGTGALEIIRTMKSVDTDSILESMTKKEPSEEGKGKCLDNTIITEFDEVIKTFRLNINRFLYMPNVFSELTERDRSIKELIKASDDIEKIMSMIKGVEL